MNEPRITWTTRINLRPSTRATINEIAKIDRISIATIIGAALDEYVTARST